MPPTVFHLLYVTDPEASARFYAQLLGRAAIESSPTFAMVPLAPSSMLGLWKRSEIRPPADAPPGAGELALTVEDRAAVDARHAHWRQLGCVVLQAPTAMDFGYTFVVQDPDGHRLRVFAPEGQ